jgi:hypothetical protein
MGWEVRKSQNPHHVIRTGLGHHGLGERVVRHLENVERNVVRPEKDMEPRVLYMLEGSWVEETR